MGAAGHCLGTGGIGQHMVNKFTVYHLWLVGVGGGWCCNFGGGGGGPLYFYFDN